MFNIEMNHTNLLPSDGAVYAYPQFVPSTIADSYYQRLVTEVLWEQHYVNIYGKSMPSPRLSAWFGDDDAVYQYSGVKYEPLPWSQLLLEIKAQIEARVGVQYNSCLANWYRDGADGMGWHADNEPELGNEPNIASLSLGATRQFVLRHNNKQFDSVKLNLGHGDLLVMQGETQRHWQHCVTKTKKPTAGRVNLTFRLITT